MCVYMCREYVLKKYACIAGKCFGFGIALCYWFCWCIQILKFVNTDLCVWIYMCVYVSAMCIHVYSYTSKCVNTYLCVWIYMCVYVSEISDK